MSYRSIYLPVQIESRLLLLAGAYLGVYSLALTFSPAARLRTWNVDYRWAHWLGLAAWLALFWLAHRQLEKRLPARDPYLLPLAALLSGWGLLTIWRLTPDFGLRQSAWLLVSILVLIAGLRLPVDLQFLRRYKYIWLTSGLLLTAATLFLGTNPLGSGPRLWLGCCGLYLQPSEPLKLLLIIYLAAYLADHQPRQNAHRSALPGSTDPTPQDFALHLLPLLAPTLLMTGLALLLLVFQRDLGTASIFLFLYAAIVYISTGDRRVLLSSALALAVAGIAGYLLFDVVRLRVDAWLNPWLDPSGRSYQIVQSLMAVANGGIFGRGPGLGNPGLVPVAQSDFIFAAIAEESGLVGALGLVLLIALLVNRGVRLAQAAADPYRRLLAAGLAAHLGAQSILIIGGNLRLLPLTGVTLPFVSYGGSSLLVSFLELLLLLQISKPPDPRTLLQYQPSPYHRLAGGLLLGLLGTAFALGWWGFWRGPDLLTRTDNPRRAIADRYIQRGSLLDHENIPLAESSGQAGEYERHYPYPDLGVVIGYTHPIYGQSGLEASLDNYLRGLQGNSDLSIWWNHLLYGLPPSGLDTRLSLDLGLQATADELLGESPAALVLLNAQSGEFLAMASHPTFDANLLDRNWESLIQNPDSPLFNRATMGLYPTGPALGGFLLASQYETGKLPDGPHNLNAATGEQVLTCAFTPIEMGWGPALSSGCPGATAALGESLGSVQIAGLFERLGLYSAPKIHLPTLASPLPQGDNEANPAALGLADPQTGEVLLVSPLQMALAAASLSNAGTLPAPRLAMAVDTPQSGWVLLMPLSQPTAVFNSRAAESAAAALQVRGMSIWQIVARTPASLGPVYTWFLGGTLPDWPGVPLAVAVLLEANDPGAAMVIGQAILAAAMQP